jgi:hypothetical protein
MPKKTTKVGANLKSATTVADIGNMMRGKDVLRIKRCPDVIAFTPPVRLFAMR